MRWKALRLPWRKRFLVGLSSLFSPPSAIPSLFPAPYSLLPMFFEARRNFTSEAYIESPAPSLFTPIVPDSLLPLESLIHQLG